MYIRRGQNTIPICTIECTNKFDKQIVQVQPPLSMCKVRIRKNISISGPGVKKVKRIYDKLCEPMYIQHTHTWFHLMIYFKKGRC